MIPTFVIAEAAATHDGDLGKALRLIAVAKTVGADAVKFQWTTSAERLATRRRAPEYLEAYRGLEFPRVWFPRLAEAARAAGLEFMCTAYLPEDLAIIEPYVSRFKVASFEAGDAHFIALHAEFPKPLIVSVGMAQNPNMVRAAYFRSSGENPAAPTERLAVLHCVSAYPCPNEQANLARLRFGGDGFSRYDGYSDHTKHEMTGALAVAAGARIVEFHLRLTDTRCENSDYAVARTITEAATYIANIRAAERLMGDGERGLMEAEQAMVRYRVRRP